SIPALPLFFRGPEKAAWERNHPLEWTQSTKYWNVFGRTPPILGGEPKVWPGFKTAAIHKFQKEVIFVPMRKKSGRQRFEQVEVIDAGAKGKAVAKAPDGRVIFLSNAVPGDVVDVW